MLAQVNRSYSDKILPVDPDGYSVVTYTQYTPHRRNPDRPPTPKRTRFAAPEAGPLSTESSQAVGTGQVANNRYVALCSGIQGDEDESGDEEYCLDSSDYDDDTSDEGGLSNPEDGLIPHQEVRRHLVFGLLLSSHLYSNARLFRLHIIFPARPFLYQRAEPVRRRLFAHLDVLLLKLP